MCLGWIMSVYNHKKYYKKQEEKEEKEKKLLNDIQKKKASILPLYNENYRKRFNENNK